MVKKITRISEKKLTSDAAQKVKPEVIEDSSEVLAESDAVAAVEEVIPSESSSSSTTDVSAGTKISTPEDTVTETPSQPNTQVGDPLPVADPLLDENEGGASKKHMILRILLVIFTLVFVGIGFYLSYQFGVTQGKLISEKEMIKAADTKGSIDAPKPTKVVEVAKDKYTISVLNGSGIAKEASRVQDVLEDDGYSVSSIGNTEEDTKDSIIETSEDVEESYLMDLKKLLMKTYKTVKLEKLAEEAETDIVIIVGSDKIEN